MHEKKYEEAKSLLESDRVKAVARHDERAEGRILDQLGLIYELQGKFLAAHTALDGAVSRLTVKGPDGAPSAKDSIPAIEPLNDLANLLYESGEISEAEATVHKSIAILNAAMPHTADDGVELALLAKVYLGEHKLPPARHSAEESLEIFRDTGHPEALAASIDWSVVGAVCNEQGDSEGAEESLQRALSIVEKRFGAEDYRVGEAIANLGLLYASHGEPEKAEPLLEQAHSSFRAHEVNTLFVRSYLTLWADFEHKRGNKQKAKDLTSEAKALGAARSEASLSRYMLDANSFR